MLLNESIEVEDKNLRIQNLATELAASRSYPLMTMRPQFDTKDENDSVDSDTSKYVGATRARAGTSKNTQKKRHEKNRALKEFFEG